MTVASTPVFDLDDSFARELVGLHQPWQAEPVSDPELLVMNDDLAGELGLDPALLRSERTVAAVSYTHLTLPTKESRGWCGGWAGEV